MKALLSTALVAAGFLAAASAGATPVQLVTNGNFETGTFAGWTKSGNPDLSDVVANNVTSNTTYVWRSGATGSPAFISQQLGTIAGTLYSLSFDVFNSATSNATFEADFNGATVFAFANQVHNWTHYEFDNLLATSSSTNLTFGARNDPSFIRLDNVSVVADAVGAVPEPATLPLVLAAVGALAWTRRRRRRGA